MKRGWFGLGAIAVAVVIAAFIWFNNRPAPTPAVPTPAAATATTPMTPATAVQPAAATVPAAPPAQAPPASPPTPTIAFERLSIDTSKAVADACLIFSQKLDPAAHYDEYLVLTPAVKPAMRVDGTESVPRGSGLRRDLPGRAARGLPGSRRAEAGRQPEGRGRAAQPAAAGGVPRRHDPAARQRRRRADYLDQCRQADDQADAGSRPVLVADSDFVVQPAPGLSLGRAELAKPNRGGLVARHDGRDVEVERDGNDAVPAGPGAQGQEARRLYPGRGGRGAKTIGERATTTTLGRARCNG